MRRHGTHRAMSSRARVTCTALSAAIVIASTSAAALLGLVGTASTAAAASAPVLTPVVADSLNRVVPAGWGAAGLGGAWSMSSDSTAASAVDGSRGKMLVASGGSREAVLKSVSALDTRSLVRLSVATLPTTGRGVYFSVDSRVSGTTRYQQRVRILPGGQLELSTLRSIGSTATAVGTATLLPTKVAAGQDLLLRVETSGQSPVSFSSKAWLAGAAEPSWQRVVTDTSSAIVKAAGSIGVWAYTSSSTAPSTLRVDSLTVDKLSYSVATSDTPPVTSPSRPDAKNTGVPDGVALSARWGDLVITTPGAVYDALDIHGFVRVQAPNVTIRRSIIRGGVATTSVGLVTNTTAAATNFVIEDSTLLPASPSVYIDGLKGGNYVARRLDISGVVDGAKVHGDNVRVEGSWIHDTRQYTSDPYQGGGPSHNDGVQVLGGANLAVTGNSISGAGNAAIQVTQDYSDVRGLKISGNWLGNGNCTVNVSQKGGGPVQGLSLTSNRFSRNSVLNCAVIIPSTTSFTATDDLWIDTLSPVLIRRN